MQFGETHTRELFIDLKYFDSLWRTQSYVCLFFSILHWKSCYYRYWSTSASNLFPAWIFSEFRHYLHHSRSISGIFWTTFWYLIVDVSKINANKTKSTTSIARALTETVSHLTMSVFPLKLQSWYYQQLRFAGWLGWLWSNPMLSYFWSLILKSTSFFERDFLLDLVHHINFTFVELLAYTLYYRLRGYFWVARFSHKLKGSFANVYAVH